MQKLKCMTVVSNQNSLFHTVQYFRDIYMAVNGFLCGTVILDSA